MARGRESSCVLRMRLRWSFSLLAVPTLLRPEPPGSPGAALYGTDPEAARRPAVGGIGEQNRRGDGREGDALARRREVRQRETGLRRTRHSRIHQLRRKGRLVRVLPSDGFRVRPGQELLTKAGGLGRFVLTVNNDRRNHTQRRMGIPSHRVRKPRRLLLD